MPGSESRRSRLPRCATARNASRPSCARPPAASSVRRPLRRWPDGSDALHGQRENLAMGEVVDGRVIEMERVAEALVVVGGEGKAVIAGLNPFDELLHVSQRVCLLDLQHAIETLGRQGKVVRRIVDELDRVDRWGIDLPLRIVILLFVSVAAGKPGLFFLEED